MKKISALIIAGMAIFGTHQASAQIQKGNLMVGASLADMNIKLQKGNTDLSLSINPKIGYFIQDNVAIGAEVKLGFATNSAQNSINYGIGAFGRYYVSSKQLELLKHARFFGEVNAGLVGDNIKPKGMSSVSTNGLGIGFGPGVAYFITPNIGLEALLKYNLGVGFGSSTTTNNFSIGFGFQIYLPTKKARAIYNEASGEVRSKMKKSNKEDDED
ncbi:outer membrane beta-barrel protein [Taibaiella chishuiensis]|uniref:Outer membrane protein with beta-barrel domain n=1 Tax=Taibaiella chishuiensis TaxID=1434707 RepID=A0A2P8DB87_9BACT|nr:outer membrane beta-barrel protein [Taibaiella chishuiensis]PSK94488.1 outer membrane protein with beta-barrel domain [Taibaiella chishuiensis]